MEARADVAQVARIDRLATGRARLQRLPAGGQGVTGGGIQPLENGRHGIGGRFTERLLETLHPTARPNAQTADQLGRVIVSARERVEFLLDERAMQNVERFDQPAVIHQIGVDIGHDALHTLAAQALLGGAHGSIP